MSIVFATGFDHYIDHFQIFNSAVAVGTAITITSVGRNGTNAIRFTGDDRGYVTKTLPATISTICLGFAYKIAAIPAAGVVYIAWLNDGATIQTRLGISQTTGLLGVYRGNTLLVNSSGIYALQTGVFYHISWKSTIGNSGSTVVKLNEVEIINQSGIDNQNTANSTCDSFSIGFQAGGGEGSSARIVDDLVVDNAVQLPDLAVKTLLPTGAGLTVSWTAVGAGSVYQAVDDLIPNSNVDYAVGSTVGEYSLLTYPTINTTASIYAVQYQPFAEKTDAGTATFASIYYDGSTIYDGDSKGPSDSSYAYHTDIDLVSPATGITWTVSDFNAGQYGFKRLT